MSHFPLRSSCCIRVPFSYVISRERERERDIIGKEILDRERKKEVRTSPQFFTALYINEHERDRFEHACFTNDRDF